MKIKSYSSGSQFQRTTFSTPPVSTDESALIKSSSESAGKCETLIASVWSPACKRIAIQPLCGLSILTRKVWSFSFTELFYSFPLLFIAVSFAGAQALLFGLPDFGFMRFRFHAARNFCRNACRRTIVQALDFSAKIFKASGLVAMLAAFGLRCCDNARQTMRQPHGTFRRVDVLPATPARAKRIHIALGQKVFV